MRKLLITALLLVNLSYPAWAGTSLQGLSKTVEIVDMDKWIKERDKALEYERKVKGAMVQCKSSSTTITRMRP